MRGQIFLGTTVPLRENSVQFGKPNYEKFSLTEASLLISLLYKAIDNEEPEGCLIRSLIVKGDVPYRDVVIIYDTENMDTEQWALKVESLVPEVWPEEAEKLLNGIGYPLKEVRNNEDY
jgi:hypothetical protein